MTLLMTASTYGHFSSFHLPYLESLAEVGVTVDIACQIDRQQPTPNGVRHLIPVPFEKKMTSLQNLKAAKVLRKQIKENQYDRVICHTTLAAFFTRLAMTGLKKRPYTISMVHGYLYHAHSSFLKTRVLRLAEKILAPKTDVLLTMNQWDFQEATRHKLGKNIQSVSGIGVNPSIYDYEENPLLREESSVHQDEFLLLFGGEFSKRKNQMFLIRAMKQLPQEVHLALAGKGELLEECKLYVQNHHLEDRIHFLGHVPNLPQWYQAADAVVSGCVSEGLAVHLLEALSLGCAVVVSDVKGHQDVVFHDETGLLFPYGDQEEYVKQVLRCKENAPLRHHIKRQSKEKTKPYGLETVLPQIMKEYLD